MALRQQLGHLYFQRLRQAVEVEQGEVAPAVLQLPDVGGMESSRMSQGHLREAPLFTSSTNAVAEVSEESVFLLAPLDTRHSCSVSGS